MMQLYVYIYTFLYVGINIVYIIYIYIYTRCVRIHIYIYFVIMYVYRYIHTCHCNPAPPVAEYGRQTASAASSAAGFLSPASNLKWLGYVKNQGTYLYILCLHSNILIVDHIKVIRLRHLFFAL